MKKIIIICLLLITLTGCKDERLNQRNEQEFISEDKLSEKITMESSIINDSLLLFITNNNKTTIDMDIKVEFYNKKDKVVSTEEDIYSAIKDKKELVVIFDIYKEYEYYKVFIESEKSAFISYEDKINITEENNIDNNQINFKITNNAEEAIEYLELAIIYYKENKIVGYDYNFVTNFKKSGTTSIDFSYPYNANYDLVEYDNYKLFINEACTYNRNSN